ncbi:hypothetical protein NliqN6_6860 [Naganishia liquefaciens]|uniref:Uncharacterized protein n=1 Tax=Naganishia liquefaciens TaxID=104408 RepID=A0A8H3YIJ2_9TREE|nr:hypothetical protein NliqN6_6860 [Naganishia liquefaciens]
MASPFHSSLVSRLTTTFSRQRRRQSHLVRQTLPNFTRPLSTAATDSIFEDGFTVPEPSNSFLEAESDEYRRVILPPREAKAFTPVWPTILEHPSRQNHSVLSADSTSHPHAPVTYLSDTQRSSSPCESIQRLIHDEKNLAAARQLMLELRELGTPIKPHSAYLEAAIHQSRRRGYQAMQADILYWLSYWYAFPPAKQFRHAPIVALEPLVETILERWSTDLAFLRQLLVLAAERGWIPALMPVVFRHYTTATDPADSYALLDELAAIYAEKTPRRALRRGVSPQDAEARRAAAVVEQVSRWRNAHLRMILQNGHVGEAKMIYRAGEARGVFWYAPTKEALVAALQSGKNNVMHPVQEREISDPTATPMRQILHVAHHRSRQPVRNLVAVLDLLESQGRSTLIARISKRFVCTPGRPRHVWSTNETTTTFWYMAQMIRMRRSARHADALALFRSRFYLIGLPRVANEGAGRMTDAASNASRGITDRKLYPSPEVLSTILPSVIALSKPLMPDALVALHNEFLAAASTYPSIKSDPIFHLPFITHHAHTFGASAAEKWCERLEKDGVTVGVQGWSVVAVQYAKSRKMSDIQHILDRMTVGHQGDPSLLSSTQPNEKTFVGIAATLLKRKKFYKAKAVLEQWDAEQQRRRLVAEDA